MATPVQLQYQELKKQNPDAILFFRLGDFYELFFEDAQIGARVLGIVLTARHKGTDNEMPMCGFPYHAHEEYLETLIEHGYKVAIAEQVEDPDTKKITREIARVVTPGTSMESGNLNPDSSYYLVGIIPGKKDWSLAYVDVSTGEYRCTTLYNEESVLSEVYRLNPREILLDTKLFENESFVDQLPKVLLTPRRTENYPQSAQRLKEHFNVPKVEVLDCGTHEVLTQCCAFVLAYLADTQRVTLPHINQLRQYVSGEKMVLDRQTLRHLEVFQPLIVDETPATLWSVFEKSSTAMGGRTLRSNLAAPLLDIPCIWERQEAVGVCLQDYELRSGLHKLLGQISDIERLVARVATGRCNARDLHFIRESLAQFPEVINVLKASKTPLFEKQRKDIGAFETLFELLEKALVEHPPVEITQGGMIQDGYDKDLDQYRGLSTNAQAWLDDFLAQKKEETGITGLRVKHHKNFGFCIEVSKGQKQMVPEGWIPRQTLVNAERYSTPELAEYEQNALSAESNAFAREHELFLHLREQVMHELVPLQKAARAIGMVDMILTLARTADKYRWNRPTFTEKKQDLHIEQGRHPVVEALSSDAFIPNDLEMKKKTLHLITGPNMAGKSTFLRQNALIILLAQLGSYVPAKSATLGVFDRIFTRVGASDNVAAGKSTFFVEMTETASILRSATDRSFIILDEIGRGTSTFDGISIAWAILEHLHGKVRAKTLFATHYHELIDLAEELPRAGNYHISVTQNKGGIVFLRKILQGGMSDSFGVEVASLAGVPSEVVSKAREVLTRLESENLLSGKPNLFSAPRTVEKIVEIEKSSPVVEKLKDISPDNLSPKEALEILYDLKKDTH